MIAQVEENQVAQIAADVHPPGQKYGLPGVLSTKLAAIVRSLPITQQI
jgi:hypothetical protein